MNLGEPEVGQLDVVVAVEENVLRLQVAVDNIAAVAVLDGIENLRMRKLCEMLIIRLDILISIKIILQL